MDLQEVLSRLNTTSEYEQRAMDFYLKHKRKPEKTDLLEIYCVNVLEYVPNTVYSSYLKNKNAVIPSYITFLEKHAFDKDTNISLSRADRFIEMFPLKHDYFEIEYVLSGACKHTVANQNYLLVQGDIAIVPPNVIYKANPDDDCIMINLKIRRSAFDRVFVNFLSSDTMLSAYFSKTLYSKEFRSSMMIHCKEDIFLKELFLTMYAQQLEKKAYYELMLEGLTVTLFSHLMQNHGGDIESTNRTVKNDNRISHITDYISNNYNTVTLKSAAQKFYFSEPYLSTLIKEETGATFSELLREIKMNRASHLLLTTSLKIDEICEASGYKDTTQFIKTFKKYFGLSPKKYRDVYKIMSAE